MTKQTISQIIFFHLFVTGVSPVWADRVEYQYDQLGSLSETRYENGEKIVYSFDSTGNRSQVLIETNAIDAALDDLNGDGIVDRDDVNIIYDLP